MCFGLGVNGGLEMKEGQIAHLDRDRSNSAAENLVFLCQAHHTEYDKTSPQIAGFSPEEVRGFRRSLHEKFDDPVMWTLTIIASLNEYDKAREVVDRAKATLREFSK